MFPKRQIPVYLFTGFLDAGKTKFINETLMGDKRFTEGKTILLILCEEGEEEYEPSLFSHQNVYCGVVEDPNSLTPETLAKFADGRDVDLVLIEYNGMWALDNLYRSLPEGWVVAQETAFFDATTILTYNTNMRAQVVDKLQSCDLAVFNRVEKGGDIMPYHKLVRGISRGATIVYDFTDGTTQRDEIEDPLPFDINAPVIEIEDRDFALWYRDMSEKTEEYNGKTVSFRGMVAHNPDLRRNEMILGRKVMTCCADDIAYTGLVAEYDAASLFPEGSWMKVTAKIYLKKHSLYERKGPVLKVSSAVRTDPPAEEIATFY